MMEKEITSPTVTLKLFLDKNKTRVLAAEATTDFVDALLSFLTLPLGTIIRVTDNLPGTIGCMNNLYQSTECLSTGTFSTKGSKSMLLKRFGCHSDIHKGLRLNLDDLSNGIYFKCYTCCKWSYYPDVRCCEGVADNKGVFKDRETYCRSSTMFVISDDLQVLRGLPSSLVRLFQDLGCVNINQIEYQSMLA